MIKAAITRIINKLKCPIVQKHYGVSKPKRIILKDVFKGWNKNQEYGYTKYAKDNPGYYSGGIHKGWDFGEKKGKIINVAHDGIVVKVVKKQTYNKDGVAIGKGLMVSVCDRKQGIATRYCHMSKILVRKGRVVKAGDAIGKVGDTGFSKGSHLHWELLLTDDNCEVLNSNNVFKGTINPADKDLVKWVK